MKTDKPLTPEKPEEERISDLDLVDWQAAQQNLAQAQAVVQWEQLRLVRRYTIEGLDQILPDGRIVRGPKADDPGQANANGALPPVGEPAQDRQ